VWLTVRGVLAAGTTWAPAGHEVCWGQVAIPGGGGRSGAGRAALARPAISAETVTLGPGVFDARSGLLLRLGELELGGPRLDVWRAPTDNDEGQGSGNAVAAGWRRAGLDRMEHRTDAVEWGPDYIHVSTRVAAANSGLALRTAYRWVAEQDALRLIAHVVPEGEWNFPLPRLGVLLTLPAHLDRVAWFGRGPGESYPDSCQAARVGRYRSNVDEMQTPYVMPQENGHRMDVRWAELTGSDSTGLRVDGMAHFGLTVRRLTSDDLARARHTIDLGPRDRLFVNLDHAQQGLGTASCGPGVLPWYRLDVRETTFEVVLRAI
jgi:beta-galactosidase